MAGLRRDDRVAAVQPRDLPHQREPEAHAPASPPRRWNGENTRSRSASGMPAPLSITSSMARPPSLANHDADRRSAVVAGVLEEIADQARQQPPLAPHRQGLAFERAVVIARAFLRRERKQIDAFLHLRLLRLRRAGW